MGMQAIVEIEDRGDPEHWSIVVRIPEVRDEDQLRIELCLVAISDCRIPYCVDVEREVFSTSLAMNNGTGEVTVPRNSLTNFSYKGKHLDVTVVARRRMT